MLLGIKDGMVMQRNELDVCDVCFSSDRKIESAAYDGPANGSVAVSFLGNLRYRLTGIPAGGPYRVRIGSECFENIYVGDVWILAGQSNMEGLGHYSEADHRFSPTEKVRALYLNNAWGPANHPLHELGSSYFKVHAQLGGTYKPDNIGAGPGLSFGLSMYKHTKAPQGLICCAHGGTDLAYHWNPDRADEGTDASLYAAMRQRVVENGSHVRGLFWYQGCSDADKHLHAAYTDHMVKFITACRKDFGSDLPVVQVQIGRTVSLPTAESCRWWNSIQEQQRTMHEHIPHLSTVSSITKSLDDAIHLDSDSQRELGDEAAEAMYQLVFPSSEKGFVPPPQMDHCWIEETGSAASWMKDWVKILIRYKNLHGSLGSKGRPAGFEVFRDQTDSIPQYVYKIELKDDTVILYLAATRDQLKTSVLYYGHGQNPACNITDSAGRSLPVMGPISWMEGK